jgi:hypothetical protein
MGRRGVQQQVALEPLPALLRDVYEGKLLLPDSQQAPWDDARRLQLFESIYRGVPLGSITVWRTSERMAYRRAIGTVPLHEPEDTSPPDYLIEGSERMVVLFEELGPAFLLQDPPARRPGLPLEKPRSFLVYDLRTQTFRAYPPEQPLRQTEFALMHLFHAESQYAYQSNLRALPDGEQLIHRLNRLVDTFFEFELAVIRFASGNAEAIRTMLSSLGTQLPLQPRHAPVTTHWSCDTCAQPIWHARDGWVEWLSRDKDSRRTGRGLRLVHHLPASPLPQGCQYDERQEFKRDQSILHDLDLASFLGANGLTHLLYVIDYYHLPQKQGIEMIQRLHTPGYERARFHAAQAIAQGVIEPNLPSGFYWQDEIAAVLEWADTHGLKP